MVKRVYIEGNIGCGKSTFCRQLQEVLKTSPEYQVELEPLDEWLNIKNSNGENMLELYYKDPKEYGFVFQMTTFMTRCKANTNVNPETQVMISERSNFTDKYIFTEICKENGYINEIQEKVYNSLFDWLVKDSLDGDLYVYLRADYMICNERIKKRARSEESQVPVELLKTLQEKHDAWLLNLKDNCIVIDTGNITEDDYETVIKELIAKINKIL